MIMFFPNIITLIRKYIEIHLKNALKIVSFLIVFISLYQIYQKTIHKKSTEQLTQIDKYRYLDQIDNDQFDNKCNNNSGTQSMKPVEQEFILNITQFPYKGQWSTFKFLEYKFENKQGDVEYSLSKGHIINKQLNHKSNSSMLMSFLFKDGEYIDNFVMANISFTFPTYLFQRISSSTKTLKPIIIANIPCLFSYYNGNFFENKGNTIINSVSLTLAFYPFESLFKDPNYSYSSRNFWSKSAITIEDKSRGIHIELTSEMKSSSDKHLKVFNYSISISLITLLQICSSVTFLLDVNENNQLGCNIDLIALSLQIFYDSLLCSSHFFLTVSNEQFSLYFGICSMAYFILFSAFELNILFFCWKARFDYLIYTDSTLFRKKLMQFFVIFYIVLFLSMISLSFWFNHFCLFYLLFSSAWLFQIIHSVKTSTRPPMRYEYIVWFTLGKVIFPVSHFQ